MLLTLTLAYAAPGGCPLPRSVADLDETLASAERAWGADADAFSAATADVESTLRCLVEPLPSADAAWVHRLEGLAAFARRDMGAATAAFAAARAIEPEYRFPEALVAPGNPVDTLYRNALTADTAVRLPAPRAGWSVKLDGAPGTSRITERPVVAQVIDPVGRVSAGAWVPVNGALPSYPTAGAALRAPLLITGATLAVVGAGLWTFAALTRPDPASLDTVEQGQSAEARQAALGGTALGVGGLGVVTLGTALVVGRW